MLTLVFSKEEAIIKTVVETYQSIYFDNYSFEDQAANMIQLMKDATLTDITCIEEFVKKFIQEQIIGRDFVKQLIRIYSQKRDIA